MPFPLIASLAPVVVAGALWAITRSPYALLFAVIGPCVAVASVLDRSRSDRRRRRRSAAEHTAAIAETALRIEQAHDTERIAAWRETPSAFDLLLSGDEDAGRWRREDPAAVVLGTGELPSGLHIAGGEEGAGDAEHNRLLRLAERVDGMPVTTAVGGGIGLVGPPALARSVLRGLLLQLVSAEPPHRLALGKPPAGADWDWTAALPHSGSAVGRRIRIVDGGPPGADDDAVLLAIAEVAAALPSGCTTVVRLRSAVDAEVVSGMRRGLRLTPELVSLEQAAAHAALLARWAPADALRAELPFAALEQPEAGEGLAASIGQTEHGATVLDLVRDGPHAVIGGTTGSGKSELIVAWLLAMAATREPERFGFLLLDFKGGATAGVLSALPHCRGVATDLDGALADRALSSLRAELRYRERCLAEAGITDVGDPRCDLGRLVVVVDELAALLSASPDAHALLSDIAARGRSLGVHLILCTQRPAGVIRESLLANCGLRILLRVNDPADSRWLVGSDAAARLPRDAPGRCVIATHSGHILSQIAHATRADVATIRARYPGGVAARAVWLPPLPAILSLREVPSVPVGTLALGLLDEPEEQRRRPALWRPAEHGPLLLAGGPRSGLSSLIATLAEQTDALPVPRDEEELWDLLTESPLTGRLTLIDDWDRLLGLLAPDHRVVVGERLTARLRSGAAVVVATRRPSALGSQAALFGRRVVLRFDDRSDHLALGAPAALWNPAGRPGEGSWEGLRFQAATGDRPAPAAPSRLCGLPAGPLAVVSNAPAAAAERLGTRRRVRMLSPGLSVADGGDETIIADPDAWLAAGGALAALHRRLPVVIDGLAPAEFRLLTRVRDLPPPLRQAAGRIWLWHPDGRVERAAWPLPNSER